MERERGERKGGGGLFRKSSVSAPITRKVLLTCAWNSQLSLGCQYRMTPKQGHLSPNDFYFHDSDSPMLCAHTMSPPPVVMIV